MSEKIIYISSDEFEKTVLKSKVPVIVDFYSEDCPPCEVLAPIFEKMAEKYGNYIKFVKILRQSNRELAKSINVSSSPTVLFYKDGKETGSRLNGFMNKPEVRKAIEEILGDVIPKEDMRRRDCDVLILGAGAAGLSAAIYTSRAKMDTVIIDESMPGGQAASTYHISNYPGTRGVIRGREIIDNMRQQAQSFGAVIEDLKEIFEIKLNGREKYVKTEDTEYFAKALIIATGAKPIELPAEQADEFKGKGVHYCAICDGSMYQDRKVVVIGGGNSAVEEAIFLTKFASHVTIIHQFDNFQAARVLQDEVFKNKKIDIIWDSEVRKVKGQNHSLTSVMVENLKTKEMSEVSTDGAFVYIGTEPSSKMFEGLVKMDEHGYIIASEDTLTNIDGVFAAGDVRKKPVKQVITAASDGAVAGIMAERYVAANKM